jgi:hypothetical protein
MQAIFFPSDSSITEIRGFSNLASLMGIEFPRQTAVRAGFDRCDSLFEIIFGNSRKEFQGFRNCPIQKNSIPESVEIIHAFSDCRQLHEVGFMSNTRREVQEFDNCEELEWSEIPGSVLTLKAFHNRKILKLVVFGSLDRANVFPTLWSS